MRLSIIKEDDDIITLDISDYENLTLIELKHKVREFINDIKTIKQLNIFHRNHLLENEIVKNDFNKLKNPELDLLLYYEEKDEIFDKIISKYTKKLNLIVTANIDVTVCIQNKLYNLTLSCDRPVYSLNYLFKLNKMYDIYLENFKINQDKLLYEVYEEYYKYNTTINPIFYIKIN